MFDSPRGGDHVTYNGNVSTKMADLTTVKVMLNSIVSTPNTKFMSSDIKDFYLNTPMDKYKYMWILVTIIPDTIMQQYDLIALIHNKHIYIKICKGMYGLPQAGTLPTKFLTPHGFTPVPITPGLWKHTSRDLAFMLVVDNFDVKYINNANAQHLLDALHKSYIISKDWAGTKYCGHTLDWDYVNHICNVSMPRYIVHALQCFQHPMPTHKQHSPHAWQKPQYGAKTQFAPSLDTLPTLDASNSKRVQDVLSTLLFYACTINSTMLPTIGTLASQQAQGTEATLWVLTQLLN